MDVLQTTLSNGLKVLLKEIHTTPIISHWLWVKVGSRDETPGITGVSHWVEHMQFKGTPNFPAGKLDRRDLDLERQMIRPGAENGGASP